MSKIEAEDLLNSIFSLVEEGKYEEALQRILALPEKVQEFPSILYRKGDCLLMLGMDLEALKIFVRYISQYPENDGVRFAKFNLAICLENLGLDEEALRVISDISPPFLERQEEIDHIRETVKMKQEVREILRSGSPFTNQ